jgi:methyl-accepting chemotaxis protein
MKTKFVHSLRFKMLALIVVVIVVTASILGIASYFVAKKQLVEAGKLDLRNTVEGALTVVERLHQQEKFMIISKEEAKQQAAELLAGPKINDNKRDFKQSGFLYKDSGYIFVYDSKYVAQVHPMGFEGQDMSDLKDQNGEAVVPNLMKAAKQKDESNRFYTYSWKNEGEAKARDKIAYSVYFEPWDWMIGIGAYKEEFYEQLNELKLMTFIFTLAAAIIASVVMYMFIRKYIVSIETISDATEEIANGNLQVQVPVLKTKDEIGVLTAGYQHMVDNMKELIKKVSETGQAVAASSEELTASADETKTAANEVTVSIQEVAAGAEDQLVNVEQTNRSIQEMDHLIQEMTIRSKEVGRSAEHTSKEAEIGNESLNKVKEQMQRITNTVTQSTEVVKTLESRSTEIGKIIEVITGISDQTNLLALNAAIEAARAGEHGRGFAVVADEVRKLAEESKRSADQIGALIKEIQADTKSAYTVMQESNESVAVGMEVVTEAGQNFSKILEDIFRIQQEIKEIASATSNIQQHSAEITKATHILEEAAQVSASSAENVASASEEELAAMEEISSAAHSLSQLAQELQDLLVKFKI